MRIFLTYARADEKAAERIARRLELEQHDVFFDQDDLRDGIGYDEAIRRELDSRDLLIFLISPDSVSDGRYTLTELKFWREKWSNLNGRVLPVMARETEFDSIPASLAALNVLVPEGNLEAEVVARIAQMAASTDENPEGLFASKRRHFAIGGAIAVPVVLAVVAYFAFGPPSSRPLTPESIAPAQDGAGQADPAADVGERRRETCSDSELDTCDQELARLICLGQQDTKRWIDEGAERPQDTPDRGRDKIYFYALVHSEDEQDVGQLSTLVKNIKYSVFGDSLSPAPPLNDSAFMDGPVQTKGEYESRSDAFLIVNSQLNAPHSEGDRQVRGGDSAVYYGEGQPLTLQFTLPENDFARPRSLHLAAIAYSRAQRATTYPERLELLNTARGHIYRVCRESPEARP